MRRSAQFASGEAPLRLAIYRPHANIWFRNPVRNIVHDQRLPNKYASLFDSLLASEGRIVLTTALLQPRNVKEWLRRLAEPFELVLWCLLNRIPLGAVHFVFGLRALRACDALLLMHYGNLTAETEDAALKGERLARLLADQPAAKIVHLTHFAYCPSTGGRNLTLLRPQLLVAENNLALHSAFYARYFGAVGGRFRTVPYIAAARFRCTARFDERVRKVVATGSITYKMRSPEFVDFYRGDELQPFRRVLHDNANRVIDVVDCLISDLNASRAAASSERKSGLLRRLGRRFFYKHPQGGYYKKDIVSIYNGYTMFVVPEEICDLPAIGFVEGMACGCAYLGVEGPMYADLGMIAGVHYIAYDGSLDGLVETARHYQRPERQTELAQIAEAGRRFATESLRTDRVYGAFLAEIRAVVAASRHA